MPYPSVFKARCLSKRWNLKFSQPSSFYSIESTGSCLKLLPPSSSVESWPSGVNFQKQIALRSSQWPSSCPAYVSQDGILAFDQGFGGWRNIVSLSHFPVPSSKWIDLTLCGSLICVVTILCDCYNFFVINGITKCWKGLPQCPGFKERKLSIHPVVRVIPQIIPSGVDGCRVLCVYTVFGTQMVHTCIYDLKQETWIEEVSREAIIGDFSSRTACASVDGKLYCLGYRPFAQGPVMWVYDVDKNSWTSSDVGIELTGYTSDSEVLDRAVLDCSKKIMIAQHVDLGSPQRNPHYVRGSNQKWVIYYNIMILEVIPGSNSLRVEDLQETPPLGTWGNSPYDRGVEFMPDGKCPRECMCFRQVDDPPRHPDLWYRYHVRSKEWDTLPRVDYPLLKGRICGKGAFAPGLNPFIMV